MDIDVALAADQPAVRSRGSTCIIDYSPQVAAEDTRLRLALVAWAGNTERTTTATEFADALQAFLGVAASDVDIRPFHP